MLRFDQEGAVDNEGQAQELAAHAEAISKCTSGWDLNSIAAAQQRGYDAIKAQNQEATLIACAKLPRACIYLLCMSML